MPFTVKKYTLTVGLAAACAFGLGYITPTPTPCPVCAQCEQLTEDELDGLRAYRRKREAYKILDEQTKLIMDTEWRRRK